MKQLIRTESVDMKFSNRFSDFLFDAMVVVGLVLAVVVVIGGIFFTIRQIEHRMSKDSCRRWGVAAGRPVKFAEYNIWDWACLTPNPSQPGQWIPTNQLRGVK